MWGLEEQKGGREEKEKETEKGDAQANATIMCMRMRFVSRGGEERLSVDVGVEGAVQFDGPFDLVKIVTYGAVVLVVIYAIVSASLETNEVSQQPVLLIFLRQGRGGKALTCNACALHPLLASPEANRRRARARRPGTRMGGAGG